MNSIKWVGFEFIIKFIFISLISISNQILSKLFVLLLSMNNDNVNDPDFSEPKKRTKKSKVPEKNVASKNTKITRRSRPIDSSE